MLSSRLRPKSINIFIVNLSLSNILQLLIVPAIVTIDNLTEFFELGYFGCKSKMFLTNLFFIVPMLTLSVISVDRFLAIRYPFRDLKYNKVVGEYFSMNLNRKIFFVNRKKYINYLFNCQAQVQVLSPKSKSKIQSLKSKEKVKEEKD